MNKGFHEVENIKEMLKGVKRYEYIIAIFDENYLCGLKKCVNFCSFLTFGLWEKPFVILNGNMEIDLALKITKKLKKENIQCYDETIPFFLV